METDMNWAVCTFPDYDMIQSIVTYEMLDSQTAIVKHYEKTYRMEFKYLRPIATPKFVWGDKVSPANYPDWIGEVAGMGYHFKNEEMMYRLIIDGKMKSKRYFAADLIARNE